MGAAITWPAAVLTGEVYASVCKFIPANCASRGVRATTLAPVSTKNFTLPELTLVSVQKCPSADLLIDVDEP